MFCKIPNNFQQIFNKTIFNKYSTKIFNNIQQIFRKQLDIIDIDKLLA
jgi:hypothetical protein